MPSETGAGWDYGIKSSFLNDRLVFTLEGFYIDRNGVKAKVANTGSIDDVQAAGSQNSKGVEFDFTWEVTDNLTLIGGYGYTNARIISNGNEPFSVGRHPTNLPLDNGGIALKYRFTNEGLKGLSANIGLKYFGMA